MTRWIHCIFLILISACAQAEQSEPAAVVDMELAEAEASKAEGSAEILREDYAAATETNLAHARMVIREAQVRLRTDAPRRAASEATRLAANMGGFVLNSEVRGTEGVPREVELHLRVPQGRLEPLLVRLRELGTVLQESVTGQDVTEEFVDLSARLAAQRTLEARLLALLQTSAELKDLLVVEHELARVRSEIERKEGRGRYLKERSKMASIAFFATAPEQPLVVSSQSLASRFANSFARAGGLTVTVTESVIVAVGFLIPLIGFGLALLLPVLWFRRRITGRRSQPV